jgi:hypothetical protein
VKRGKVGSKKSGEKTSNEDGVEGGVIGGVKTAKSGDVKVV